jgi:LPS-assembly lipoprotein
MSSSSWVRRGATLAVAALLVGCGFHPLYSRQRGADFNEEMAAIKIAPVSERIGQLLTSSLREGLNPSGAPAAPLYTLSLVLSKRIGDFAIRADGTASRQLYSASVTFNLRRIQDNAVLLSGSARANDSYDVGANPYTTIVAAQDADRKAAETLSEQIVAQIAAFLQHPAKS